MDLLKDRQQEVWPILVGPQFNGYYYLPHWVQYMYYIHFISLLCGLFIDIKHVKFTWTATIQASSKFEIRNLQHIFLTRISRLIFNQNA